MFNRLLLTIIRSLLPLPGLKHTYMSNHSSPLLHSAGDAFLGVTCVADRVQAE